MHLQLHNSSFPDTTHFLIFLQVKPLLPILYCLFFRKQIP